MSGLAVCLYPALVVSLSSGITSFPKICQASTSQKQVTSRDNKMGRMGRILKVFVDKRFTSPASFSLLSIFPPYLGPKETAPGKLVYTSDKHVLCYIMQPRNS